MSSHFQLLITKMCLNSSSDLIIFLIFFFPHGTE